MDSVRVKYTLLEKITDRIVVAGLVLFWILVYGVNETNEQLLPTHFNIQGKADAFGPPAHLYLLAALHTVSVAGLYFLKWKGISLNFGQHITERNKTALKSATNQALSLFAASLLVIFSLILVETVTYDEGSRVYSFILVFFAIKIPVVFYLAKTQDIA